MSMGLLDQPPASVPATEKGKPYCPKDTIEEDVVVYVLYICYDGFACSASSGMCIWENKTARL